MTEQNATPDRPEEPEGVEGRTHEEVQSSERAMLRRAMRSTLLLVGGLVVGGGLVGWFVAGTAGVWGALVGAGLAAFFCATTIWSMQRTVGASPTAMAAGVMGAWLAKIVVLVVVLVLLRGADFYDPYVLFVVLALGAVGSALLDYQAVRGARMPYVQP
ncbi:hypothetical protein [Isoptericola sp. 178]|uniref:hypothetical protein n=1 Tax=Isoptericola sp. 178 TaxID=3064651 RepID=UPI00271414EC|nr:hypothetical protein [Isoptericola sp. 178]MDO8143030.1 hypothetical protein [Isoptericola sp. 178]